MAFNKRIALGAVLAALTAGMFVLTAYGARALSCWYQMDGEAAGGIPAESFGEYRDYIHEQSHGCTDVVLIGLDGEEIDDPAADTPIEPMTGVSLSSTVQVKALAEPNRNTP